MQENIKGLYAAFLKPKMPVLTDVFSLAYRLRESIAVRFAKPDSPKRKTALFFRTAAAAEQAGYRPCLLCRPELAPGPLLLMLRLI